MIRSRTSTRILLATSLAFFVASCGAIRFSRAWSNYTPSSDSAAGMGGRWKGEWRSEFNGHSGGLRCLMSREDDAQVVAWFYSTYAMILFFQHEVVFALHRDGDGTVRFSGAQDLGKAIGGVYRYEGTVAGDSFRATFSADNGDHGVFEMERVD